MPKLWPLNRRTWIDEHNVVYKKKGHTRVIASDGRIFSTPHPAATVFVDGRGNGLIFA